MKSLNKLFFKLPDRTAYPTTFYISVISVSLFNLFASSLRNRYSIPVHNVGTELINRNDGIFLSFSNILFLECGCLDQFRSSVLERR